MNKLLDKQTGLVLEGGGMRGVFTSGVLDYLLDHHIYFNYAVGVSAGACNGLSYISQQRGRAKKSNIDMLQKYDVSMCIGCGACEDRCPYNLPIRKMLKNVAEKFGE